MEKTVLVTVLPCCCVRAMMAGVVLGSSRKATRSLDGPARIVLTASCRAGNSARESFQLQITLAWVEARAGQAPARRWRVSPGDMPHPGSLQAPDSFGAHLLRSQSVLYLPLRSLAWMVAALTAEEEEPQVVHSGWTWPGGINDGRKY